MASKNKTALAFCIAVIALGISWLIIKNQFFASVGPQAVKARTANSFVNSVGVNVHLDYPTYREKYTSVIKPILQESKIRHLRDALPLVGHSSNPNREGFLRIAEKYKEISALGKNFILVTDLNAGSHNPSANPPQLTNIISVLRSGGTVNTITFGGGVSIIGIEGPNEWDHCPSTELKCKIDGTWFEKINNFRELDWDTKLVQHTTGIYGLIKNDSRTSDLTVIAPSLTNLHNYSSVSTANGNLLQYIRSYIYGSVTMGNAHTYCYDRQDCTAFFNNWRNFFFPKKNMITETGYPTHPQGDWKVSERQQNSFLVRDILNFYDNQYVDKVYVYELFDQGIIGSAVGFREGSFGLVRNNGSVKPIYTTLNNLLSLLDENATFTTDSLNIAIEGENIKYTLLQKSDRTFYLLVRAEDNKRTANTEVDKFTNGKLLLTENKKIELILPQTSTAPYATYNNTKEQQISVPDTLLVVKISDAVIDNGNQSGGGTTSGGSDTPTQNSSGDVATNEQTNSDVAEEAKSETAQSDTGILSTIEKIAAKPITAVKKLPTIVAVSFAAVIILLAAAAALLWYRYRPLILRRKVSKIVRTEDNLNSFFGKPIVDDKIRIPKVDD